MRSCQHSWNVHRPQRMHIRNFHKDYHTHTQLTEAPQKDSTASAQAAQFGLVLHWMCKNLPALHKVLHSTYTIQDKSPWGQNELTTCKKPWIIFYTFFSQNKKLQLKPLPSTRHSPPPQYSLTEKNREIPGSTKITHCTYRPA